MDDYDRMKTQYDEMKQKQHNREHAEILKKFENLIGIGNRMSNMMFNWSQLENSFTPAERKIMKELYESWDSACNGVTGAKSI